MLQSSILDSSGYVIHSLFPREIALIHLGETEMIKGASVQVFGVRPWEDPDAKVWGALLALIARTLKIPVNRVNLHFIRDVHEAEVGTRNNKEALAFLSCDGIETAVLERLTSLVGAKIKKSFPSTSHIVCSVVPTARMTAATWTYDSESGVEVDDSNFERV